MALRLRFEERPPTQLVDWPIPGRPHFMRSEAFRIFARELERYVAGEVAGRSFLIAGHRGAGKTSLVRRAVTESTEAGLRRLVDLVEQGEQAKIHTQGLRRPLLVRLHGPSLVAAAATPPPAPARPQPATPPPAATPATAEAPAPHQPAPDQPTPQPAPAPAPAPPADAAKSDKAANPPDPAQTALEQIAIALYRALADEVASCYAIQARASDPDMLEMAVQLRLDLDQTMDAAALRGYWDAVDCLQRGLLWPRRVAEAMLDTRGMGEQGAKEIVALVTAGQAFQVCSGAVTYKTTQKDARSIDTSREAKGGIDVKDIANRLAGLSIGALVGLGAAQGVGAPAAAGAGIGAGLLSALGVNWVSTRKTSRSRDMDYSFIADRSLATLGRDVPLVIERVQACGLAPIFLVDELDKLPNPRATIGGLIQRLKHLTTDYGFFCFLTDRDYYEFVQNALDTEPYPLEHTYFSDRLFVLYTPAELARYVRDVIVSDAAPGTSAQREDDLARSILARVVSYRSKLNTVDAMRTLSRGWDGDGVLLETSSTVVSRFDYKLIVAMQLAVEYWLRQADLAGPVEQRPEFAQITVDALYYVGREWEEGKPAVSAEEVDFNRYLAGRLRLDDIPQDAKALNALLEKRLDGPNLRQLQNINGGLCLFVSDFSLLRETVGTSGMLTPEEHPLLDVIAQEADGLLQAESDKTPSQFRYDIYGRDLRTGRARRSGQTLSAAESDAIGALEDIVPFFDRVVRELNGTVTDLIDMGLLPVSVVWDVLRTARIQAVAALVNDRPYPTIESDTRNLQAFEATFRADGERLTRILKLIGQLRRDSGHGGMALKTVLGRMARLVDFNAPLPGDPADPAGSGWPAVASFPGWTATKWDAEMRKWRDDLLIRPDPHLDQRVAPAWTRWATHVADFLLRGKTIATPIDSDDLLLAVAELPPGTLFRRNLAEMRPHEWTMLVLAGADRGPARAPPWTVVFGLRALHFDKALLWRIAQEFTPAMPPDAPEAAAMRAMADSGKTAPDGALVVVEEAALGRFTGLRDRPSIVLPRPHLEQYREPLTWLRNLQVYTEVIDEVPSDEHDQKT